MRRMISQIWKFESYIFFRIVGSAVKDKNSPWPSNDEFIMKEIKLLFAKFPLRSTYIMLKLNHLE